MQDKNWKLQLGLFFGILFVSTASVLIRYAQEDASSLIVAAYRMAFSAIFLCIIVVIKEPSFYKTYTPDRLRQAFLAGSFLAVHFASWITSLEYTSVASSVVLVTTTPLWVSILSPIVLKEKVGVNVIFGLVLAMIGGIVVGLSNVCSITGGQITCDSFSLILSGKELLGNLLALLGAFMAAGYILVGRRLRQNLSILSYTFVVYGFSAIWLVLVVILRGENLFSYSSSTFLLLFLLALVPQVFGHSLFNWALRFLPASAVSVALLGEPIGSSLLAFVILNEPPTLLEIVGGSLILFGISLTLFRKTRN